MAIALWLIMFFSLFFISAKVFIDPLGIKIRSYPKPLLPKILCEIVPLTLPSKTIKATQPEFEARNKGSGRPTKLQRRATDWLKAKINESEG